MKTGHSQEQKTVEMAAEYSRLHSQFKAFREAVEKRWPKRRGRTRRGDGRPDDVRRALTLLDSARELMFVAVDLLDDQVEREKSDS